jgi:hypothetical protein
MRRVTAILATLLLALLLTSCGSSYDAYCGKVGASQQSLGQAVAGGRPADLIAALPLLEGLQDKAPSDVRGDWDQLVGAIQGFQQALQQAGVDPSAYSGTGMPPGITAGQRASIKAAASALESRDTLAASLAVQQETRDVCHTPLSL